MRALLMTLLLLVPAAAHAQADWTVVHRASLPATGAPVDLSTLAASNEDPVRVRLSGTYSFSVDGSRIDAMGRTLGGERDTTGGPYVVLPPGSVVVESDPVAHRYVIDVPRGADMTLRFNVYGLATRHLLTATEARARLTGAIEVEHLAPPPPPPPAPTATQHVARAATGVSPFAWAGGGLSLFALLGLGLVFARRRRDPIRELTRRASRAHDAIAREVIALGPAFDPVAASAARLIEAAQQHAAHHGSLERALARTAEMSGAQARRMDLAAKKGEVRAKLEDLVARLEETAAELAGRNADATRARGVEAMLSTLGDDLDAAVSAEEELAS